MIRRYLPAEKLFLKGNAEFWFCVNVRFKLEAKIKPNFLAIVPDTLICERK